jgi:hypothetical protein
MLNSALERYGFFFVELTTETSRSLALDVLFQLTTFILGKGKGV